MLYTAIITISISQIKNNKMFVGVSVLKNQLLSDLISGLAMILDDLVGDPQAFPGAPDRYGGRTRLGRGQLGTKIISPSWGFHQEKWLL